MSGEKLMGNSTIVAEFKKQFKLKIQSDLKLVRRQIYNCNKFIFNWKQIYQKKKTRKPFLEKTVSGFKGQKTGYL